MGLDMYLTVEVYVGAKWHNIKTKEIIISKKHKALLRDKKDDFKEVNKYPVDKISTISYEVAYWRKANQIHKWFVDNVQQGKDTCERYYVGKDKVVELKNLCAELLKDKDKDKALKLLHPQDGFFFGATSEEDDENFWEYYWGDLEDTVNQLEDALKFADKYGGTFYYQASW